MVRLIFLSSVLLLLCCSAAGAPSSSEDFNPITLVSDGLRGDFEAQVVKIIGHSSHALPFAHRFGKKYETVDEMNLRFRIFMENLRLIKSTNRKGLPYRLHVYHFADWTWEEFKKQRLGAAQNSSATRKGNNKLTNAETMNVIVDLAGHSDLPKLDW